MFKLLEKKKVLLQSLFSSKTKVLRFLVTKDFTRFSELNRDLFLINIFFQTQTRIKKFKKLELFLLSQKISLMRRISSK